MENTDVKSRSRGQRRLARTRLVLGIQRWVLWVSWVPKAGPRKERGGGRDADVGTQP